MLAAPRTVTRAVKKVCPACPHTAKERLQRVVGVKNVDVRFETREAIVTYDNADRPRGAHRGDSESWLPRHLERQHGEMSTPAAR